MGFLLGKMQSIFVVVVVFVAAVFVCYDNKEEVNGQNSFRKRLRMKKKKTINFNVFSLVCLAGWLAA